MKEVKKRYAVPARIVELLFTDDGFYNDVIKIKKSSSNSNFPKTDEWRDGKGFNLSFALAGYSVEDVKIEIEESVLIVRGYGLDSIEQAIEQDPQSKSTEEFEDPFLKEYLKEGLPRIHIGSISRGIARRKFCVKQLISEEFDVDKAEATMEYGLLHIFIPEKTTINHKSIEIKSGR